jgi:hypothetical protein
MKKFILLILLITSVMGCKEEAPTSKDSAVTAGVKTDEGWVSLFDGKSFEGWHTYMRDTISDQWQIEDGAMYYKPNPDKNQGMNNLITDKKYNSFILSIDWKISIDGNSGIFYGVFEDEKYVVPYMTAPEIQIRDYTNIPDFTDKKQMSGAIFGIVGPDKDLMNKAGEWNHFLITIDHKNNLGKVELNGREVVHFPVHGDAWKALVNDSKFKEWEGFGVHPEGKIGLQDHAHGVWFRNIKIKEL